MTRLMLMDALLRTNTCVTRMSPFKTLVAIEASILFNSFHFVRFQIIYFYLFLLLITFRSVYNLSYSFFTCKTNVQEISNNMRMGEGST